MKKLHHSEKILFLTKSTSYKVLMILLAVFFSFTAGKAQTITTTGVSVTTICSATNVSANVTYTVTGTFTAGNIFTAQLSDAAGSFASAVNIGSLASVNNGTISATIPANTPTGNAYKIRVVSSTPAVTGSTSAATLTITLPPGNPSVFGNGAWNAYSYNGNNYNTYYGFYTENNTNLSSITRWDQASTPSAADASSGIAYAGCSIPADNHSVSYKRTNFACGQYQIDVTGNDDAAMLLINNVQVWSRSFASGTTVTNAWNGYLEPLSTVEFSWQENAGNSYGRINLISSTAVPVALLSSAGGNCNEFTANWTAFNNATNYFLDVATDAAFTSMVPGFNNLSTGNVTSTLVTGLTAGTQYYYRVRAENTTCALMTGNSNVITRLITVSPAGPLTICQGESVTLTAGNASTYSWSPATGLSATNTPVVTASPTTTTTYTVSADGTGCNTRSITINVNPTSGNPAVFGNGAWNVYAYNGNNFNQYYGYYTETNVSFNSTTRWGSGGSPSSANAASGAAYIGCPLGVDQHSVTYKRTNLPCGLYQIDIIGHDDDGYLFIDGVQVWVHNGCCDTHIDVWRGFLNPSSTVEFRWREYGSQSYGSVNMNAVAVPTTIMATPGANCTQFNANWNTVINTTNYFLDVATDAAFTSLVTGYNNLNVGNVTTYLVSGLTPGTIYYYRVRASNTGCGITSGNSNTMTTQVQVSASTVVICDGGSAVLTASNASTYSWSPATGLSATTGSSVTASPTANTVYTVTGTTAVGCTSTNTFTVIADTIGNPSTFGDGFWNVYCYNNIFSTYRGKYTETSLSFNSTNRWAQASTPSSANATGGNPYSGCPVTADNHGVSYKRTNFTCGLYQIDIPSHDDDAYLFINGVQVWVHNGCCDAHTNVWTGFLNSSSTVEFRWQDTGGNSYGSLTMTSVSTSPAAFTTSTATVCQGVNNVAYTVPAVNGATAYTWSYSGTGATITGTTNSVTINYSNSATSGTLSVISNNSCGASSSARTMGITVNPLPGQPGVFTTSSSAVCQGQTAVAYNSSAATAATSYTWTFPGGTGATFTGTTFTTNASFSSSATSGTVRLVGVNACGSSLTPRTIAVTVNTTPYITAGSNAPVCAGSTLNLTVTTAGSATYAWTGPNSFVSSAQNPSITYTSAAAGTYNVTATLGTCTSPSSTVVASSTTAGLWVGGFSTDWHTVGNWCNSAVPTTATDVVIPSTTNLPVVSATANARNLTINASASLTKTATGILNMYGNFTNNGAFTDNGIYTSGGSVIFRGATAQSINGATIFNNLTINNTSGVALNSTSTVNGILTLTAGTFTTNNNLSQNLYNGAIAGTGAGTTTGNINFFKTIWGDKYHYLSSPISGGTVMDWNDDVTLKLGPAYNLYTYDETKLDTNKQVGWTAITSNATALQSMKGYSLYFPRWTYNTLLDINGPYTHGTTFSDNTLTNTPSTTPVAKPASDGWQFVGNPYPSAIDWNAGSGWTKTNISNAIYTWDGRTSKYVSFVAGAGTNGGTRFIGSMQGFFVKVTSAGTGTLSMTNSVRVTSTLLDVWRTSEEERGDILRITATSGEYTDETVLRFTQNASNDYDSDLDAYKLLNGGTNPSLYTLSALADYSINSLPSQVEEKTIPLTLVTGFAGNYSFTADFSEFAGEQSVWLEDRLLGTTQNLKENNVYNVSLEKGNLEGRFFIQYKNTSAGTVTHTTGQSASNGIEIAGYLQTVSVLFPNSTGEANIMVIDALGKKVYEQNNTPITSGKIELALPVSTGIYIVRVSTANATSSQQVYLTK